MALYLDLNAIQSVPVANLNRDDLGSPKTVRYGNADRIRVSSQSWKRAIRHDIETELGEKAVRTRLIPTKVRETLEKKEGWPGDLAEFAGGQVIACLARKGITLDKNGRSSVLFFLPASGLEELTALCVEHREALESNLGKKKPGKTLPPDEVEAILKSRTGSISLLGRMLADLPGANVDGAAQVAHAFTVHAAEPQRDYFTAVDDWLGEAETGSGHLNTGEFSAGVFYRFATVNIGDLLKNLDGDRKTARILLAAFAEHFLMSLPQAKKNSTAPHTIPDLAYLAVRAQRPLSLAAAFETPVRDTDGGFASASRAALADYAASINRLTGDRHRPFHGHASVTDDAVDLAPLGRSHESFYDLIDAALDASLPSDGEQE
ncbi:type I-E CRISPR-associated protein Cas7/Cse4/CasC [Streptomyces cavernae]|uniref:type I-E CRISPR-associated protein Cas7/Cse4/CasC n=1 Tax=Streptomyces cavernae TaxID=2259034 RepID=UPI000FEC1418|nr:type I-E CRISPR-associated protein Cas7/Cse4/CasC [Streptomyces cavernae]